MDALSARSRIGKRNGVAAGGRGRRSEAARRFRALSASPYRCGLQAVCLDRFRISRKAGQSKRIAKGRNGLGEEVWFRYAPLWLGLEQARRNMNRINRRRVGKNCQRYD